MSQSRLGTVLVGGGSGFIGTSLTAQLRKRGYDVMIVSRKPGPYRMTWVSMMLLRLFFTKMWCHQSYIPDTNVLLQ